MKLACVGILAAIVGAGCCSVRQAANPTYACSHVHRGGGDSERPDNTLKTFVWAWQHGAGVECDCRLTKDGVAIMLHDNTLQRTARNAPKELTSQAVSALTYEQIAEVDVGSYISPKFAAERVPTLEAVLKEMAKYPDARLYVDDKGVGPKRLAEAARKFGVLERVWYTHCDLSKLKAWRQEVPNGKTRLWWGPGTQNFGNRAFGQERMEKKMDELRKCNFADVTLVCFDVHYNDRFDDPFLPSTEYLKTIGEECHRHGVLFTCFPYSGGNQMQSYLKLARQIGCDGFCTDRPCVLFEALDELRNYAPRR